MCGWMERIPGGNPAKRRSGNRLRGGACGREISVVREWPEGGTAGGCVRACAGGRLKRPPHPALYSTLAGDDVVGLDTVALLDSGRTAMFQALRVR